jgi:hypothetical protein
MPNAGEFCSTGPTKFAGIVTAAGAPLAINEIWLASALAKLASPCSAPPNAFTATCHRFQLSRHSVEPAVNPGEAVGRRPNELATTERSQVLSLRKFVVGQGISHDSSGLS